MKRDERVKGARECTGEEGDFHSLSLSVLILSPSRLPVPCPLLPFHLPAIAMVLTSVHLSACLSHVKLYLQMAWTVL